MVEVHAYGGYLIDQFSSGYWNKRTDEYGGSFENRTSFLREIIEEISGIQIADSEARAGKEAE